MLVIAALLVVFALGCGVGYNYGLSESDRRIQNLREQLSYWAKIAGSGKTPPPIREPEL